MSRARSPVPPASPSPHPAAAPGALTWIAIAAGVLFVVAYAGVALARMRYPFELEWMEGESIAHLERVLHGLPLYGKPSLDFTPFIYPPLYFMVSAWVAKVIGPGFLPLRMVSFAASLGSMALVYAYVRRGAVSRWPALLAACLFAATFRQGGAFLDIGRADSLFMCLMLAGAVMLRRIDAPWVSGATAGLAFVLAALTKQSALFVATPVAAALLVTDWRRGVAFTAVLAACFGGSVALLDRQSGGWFSFYAFTLPRDHPIIGQLLRGFWVQDLVGPLGLALVIGAAHFFAAPARPRLRRLVLDAAFVAGLIVTGYATRIRVGSFINVAMPAYLGVSVLCGLGLASLESARREPGGGARRAEAFVALLMIAQFALLAYKPWQQVPTAADRAAGEQIVASLGRVTGHVWVPRHPYLAAMAGKPWVAHELALQDVLRPATTREAQELLAQIRAAAKARRFALVVLDDETWVHHEFQPYYTHVAEMFGAGETKLFWPATGFVTRPDFVWVPRPDSLTAVPAR